MPIIVSVPENRGNKHTSAAPARLRPALVPLTSHPSPSPPQSRLRDRVAAGPSSTPSTPPPPSSQRTVMAMELLDEACLRYSGEVPGDCFLVNVLDWLRYTPDHVIAPSLNLQTENGGKWIKVSNYLKFYQATIPFCQQYISSGSQSSELFVLVMPYMPLGDAHELHKNISDPDFLPCTYAESVEHLRQKEHEGAQAGVGLGLANLFNQDNEDVDGAIDWDRKEGTIMHQRLGGAVHFIVTNYSVLWAKAEKYCLFQFMSDPIDDILGHMNTIKKLLYYPSGDLREVFEDKVAEAKAKLIFSMYDNDAEPHDAILSLYPEMHKHVYGEGCVHCDPGIAQIDEQDSPETMQRLSEALEDLGYDQNTAYLNVEHAQTKLMSEQGYLEAYVRQSEAMAKFFYAEQNFRLVVQPLLTELRFFNQRPTVIGVSSMDTDDES